MKNKSFLSRVCEGSRMVRERIGYGTGLPGKWNVLASVMLLLTMGIGQVWGDETIFSVSCKVTSDVTVSKGTTDQSITSSQADITGGSMYVSNGETSDKKLLLASAGPSDNKKAAFSITNGKTVFKIVLSKSIEAGDVISSSFFVGSDKDGDDGLWFSTSSSRPSSEPTTKAVKTTPSGWNDVTYTVVANDGICGESTIYVHRATATTTNFTSLTITRPSSGGGDTTAPTLSSSVPANGATNVAVSGNIVLTYSEAIASVDGNKFALSGATIGTVAIDGTDSKKVNVPYSDAANSATVTLSVDADAVADAAGNKSAALSDISFTTVAAVAPVEEIPTPCAVLIPATSGDAPAVGDVITMQTGSTGGTMKAISGSDACTLAYSTNGLSFASSGTTSRVEVTLGHLIKNGTLISLRLMANGGNNNERGLHLYTDAGSKVSSLAWAKNSSFESGDVNTFTYEVKESDTGLIGHNVFQLWRDNSVFLQELTVSNCGAELLAVTFNMHGHGTAVNPQYIAEGGKVTQPATASISGWDFGGWYKESSYDNAWDFANDVVNETTELHAKWTTHVASTDATLSALSVAGYNIGFEASKETYNVELPKGSVIGDLPAVSYTLNDAGATAVKTDATVLPGSTTVVVTAEDESTTKTYTIDFTVSTMDKYVIFSGQTNALESVPDAPSGLNWVRNSDDETKRFAFINYTSVEGYTNAISTGGSSNANRNIAVTIPADYEVVFEIAQASNSDDARRAYVGAANSTSYANALFSVESSSKKDGQKAKSDALAGGKTYYILCDNSINILEINIYMDRVSETPVISAEPADRSVCEYGTDELSVTAAVTEGTLSYQWYKEIEGDDDLAVGTNSATYAPTAAGTYYVVITNTQGEYKPSSVTSEKATVTDQTATAITAHTDVQGDVDAEKTLSVTAQGTDLSYKWQACNANGIVTDETVLATTATYSVIITADPQYYLVTVEGTCGTQTQVVKAERWHEYAQANVTGTRTWDWKSSTAGWPTAEGSHIDFANTGVEYLMANVSSQVPNNDEFRSDMLIGKGQFLWRNKSDGEYGFQGFTIKFYTEVTGQVRIYYRSPSSGQTSTITIDGKDAGSRGNSWGWSDYVLVGGNKEIEIAMTNGESGMTRVQKIEFLAGEDLNLDPAEADYTRELTPGMLSTTCLPNGGVIVGASVFEIAYMNYEADGTTPHKIYFDEIVNGEMEAGVPYIVLADEGSTGMSVFYTDSENKAAQSYHGLVGHIGETTSLEANDYFIYNNMFYCVSTTDGASGRIKLTSNRAYINLSDVPGYNNESISVPAPGRRRMSMGNGSAPKVPTAVDNVQGDNIQCIKVLIDGKFFILRGEKMYDATGRLVK